MALPLKNTRTIAQLAFRIFVRPVFPFGQWLVFKLRITNNPKTRQPFSFGYLKSGITPEAARQHLQTQGFFMNRVAYFDPGQVFSLRRLDDKLPDRQYHIRIFEDGEVTGHYEFTPEDKPWLHLRNGILEKREETFAPWLRDILA